MLLTWRVVEPVCHAVGSSRPMASVYQLGKKLYSEHAGYSVHVTHCRGRHVNTYEMLQSAKTEHVVFLRKVDQ